MLILSNIKANGFLFINLKLITLLIRHCNARSKPLPCAIAVIGYNNKGRLSITHYI